ncbi:MAG TPA: phospholipase [Clostridiales bacterium]|nr:MAG: hypothetical protein A2Y18_04825 [Clostridiales bacterium GWD2_32_19]HCC07361.1 phospholipase [Clostridiales bacterium]
MNIPKIKFDRKFVIKGLIGLLFFVIIVGLYKPLPTGISYKSDSYRIDDVEFLKDMTYQKDGKRVIEQEIFSKIYRMIDEAEDFILIDMFLFNDDYDRSKNNEFIPISNDIVNKLIEKKKLNKDIKIVFITDPINNFYGVYETKYIKILKENNIEIIITDLDKLRESNFLYAGVHNLFLNWFGVEGAGYITNPFSKDSPEVNIRGFLKLLKFKANHRKVVLTENEGLIASANPHDASSLHSNVGFSFSGDIIKDILKSEEAVAKLSGETLDIDKNTVKKVENKGDIMATIITEGKIKEEIIKEVNQTKKGDSIFLAIFYISDRDLVKSFIKASNRGVDVKLIMDANKDAFGVKKNGVPNRQVACELIKNTQEKIKVRWYSTNGEQFHTKLIKIDTQEKSTIIAGSANYTRRNIGDFNLETNIKLEMGKNEGLFVEVNEYLNKMWENKDGDFTLDTESFYEDNLLKWIVYYIQEELGLSTF